MNLLRLHLLVLPVSLMVASSGCGGDEFEANPGSKDSGVDTGTPDVAVEAVGLPLGADCSQGGECESDRCVDGVCCSAECGVCSVCDAVGHEGSCTPVPAGENPDDDCGPAGEECTGECDGQGACDFPLEGEPCGTQSCESDGVGLVAPRCDGLGACEPQAESCSPFACDSAANECFASCEGNPDACAPDAFCEGMTCLGTLPLGTVCEQPGACASDQCVDGVCCDGPCDGVCESCSTTGQEGTCTPYGEGVDPEGECEGVDEACAGTCNGASQCGFPGNSTPCAASSCDANNAQIDPRCDGSGKCEDVATSCELLDCVNDSCLASCADHGDCVDDAYCANPTCHVKKNNAALCGANYECLSGHCELTSDDERCCNTTCAAPMDCVSGECTCSGLTCPTGEICVPWYRDTDKDGFGDPAQMELGCEGTAPAVGGHSYVRNMDDCYDLNPLVNPGQTSWFQVHRGDGSFDYDCDTVQTKEWDDTIEASKACTDCKDQDCHVCGAYFAVLPTFGYRCKTWVCGVLISKSFKGPKACGQTGTLHSCNPEPGVCTNEEGTTPNTMQRCR